MLLREEYSAFAEKINREVAWNMWSVDLFILVVISIVVPPFSASYMVGSLLFFNTHLASILFSLPSLLIRRVSERREAGG